MRTQAATTWNSASVLDADFDYFADDLRPFLTELALRPAMWVGISRYDRVAFFLSGIMMTVDAGKMVASGSGSSPISVPGLAMGRRWDGSSSSCRSGSRTSPQVLPKHHTQTSWIQNRTKKRLGTCAGV